MFEAQILFLNSDLQTFQRWFSPKRKHIRRTIFFFIAKPNKLTCEPVLKATENKKVDSKPPDRTRSKYGQPSGTVCNKLQLTGHVHIAFYIRLYT